MNSEPLADLHRDAEAAILARLERLVERSGGAFSPSFPWTTEFARLFLMGMGFDATQNRLSFAIRSHGMPAPAKSHEDGRKLSWTLQDVARFAVELDRQGAWLDGCHDEKKSAWRLRNELAASRLRRVISDNVNVASLDSDQLIGLTVDLDDRPCRDELSGWLAIKLFEATGRVMDERGEHLLAVLVESHKQCDRRAAAVLLRSHFSRTE